MAKVVISAYVDEEVKKKALSLGINISKVTNNTLKILVSKLESTGYANEVKEMGKTKPQMKKQSEPEEIFDEKTVEVE